MKRITPPILLIATVTVMSLPNIALSVTEPMSWMARVCNVMLPVPAYLLLMTLMRNTGRMVWAAFPLIFLAAFQLVLLYLFGGSIIAVDMFLNLLTTNTGEVSELLGSLIPAVAMVAVIYLPVLCCAARGAFIKSYRLTPRFVAGARRWGVAALALGLASLAACYAFERDYRATDGLYPVNVCYNIGLAVDRTCRTARYAETSAGFIYDSRATHPDTCRREVYVLVIGETARAANFGLYGYSRNTTPLLSSTEGIIPYPKAYTQSNTTHKSVPMLMSAATAENYNRIYREKGIITAFKEAGFNTTFISNQRPNRSFIDLFGKEAHSWDFLKEELPDSANLLDSDMAVPLKKILDKGGRREFIVLHTYGSHFRYRERYPREFASFLPDEPSDAIPENRRSLLNAYDNTILYTDSFLHSIITDLAATGANTGLIYVSDHGENIFDDSHGLFLHASPRPSAYELHVPLIVWLSKGYRDTYPETYSQLQRHTGSRVITSASVFHTMLDIAGIRTRILSDSLSLASPLYRTGPYNYLSDRNIPVPASEIVRK